MDFEHFWKDQESRCDFDPEVSESLKSDTPRSHNSQKVRGSVSFNLEKFKARHSLVDINLNDNGACSESERLMGVQKQAYLSQALDVPLRESKSKLNSQKVIDSYVLPSTPRKLNDTSALVVLGSHLEKGNSKFSQTMQYNTLKSFSQNQNKRKVSALTTEIRSLLKEVAQLRKSGSENTSEVQQLRLSAQNMFSVNCTGSISDLALKNRSSVTSNKNANDISF